MPKAKVSKAVKSYVDNKLKTLGELKGIGHAFPAPTTTPQFHELTSIAQGNGTAQREGDSIQGAFIHMKGTIQKGDNIPVPVNSGNQSSFVRLMIIRDKSQDGSDPVLGDIFASNTAYTLGHSRIQELWSLRRFEVLYDRVFPLQIGGIRAHAFSIFKRIRTKTTYAASAAGDGTKNRYWLMYGMSDATSCSLQGAVYYKYHDV